MTNIILVYYKHCQFHGKDMRNTKFEDISSQCSQSRRRLQSPGSLRTLWTSDLVFGKVSSKWSRNRSG